MYTLSIILSALLATANAAQSPATGTPAPAAGGGSAPGPGMTTDLTLPADKKSGEATFYTFWNSPAVSCNPMKCPDDGFCAAIPLVYMGQTGATKASCGKCIKMVYKQKAAIIRVMDTCPECPEGNVDLTDKLFEQLIGNKDLGRVKMEWAFVDCNSGAAASGPAGGASGQQSQGAGTGQQGAQGQGQGQQGAQHQGQGQQQSQQGAQGQGQGQQQGQSQPQQQGGQAAAQGNPPTSVAQSVNFSTDIPSGGNGRVSVKVVVK